MIVWPDYPIFPRPSVAFGVTVNTSTVRSKMDSGRIRQRPRFTKNTRQMSVSWKLSDFERSVFQSIYANLLNNGADWFSMVLPLGDGFKTFTVRFVADSYKEKYDEVMYWDVSANLETEDKAEAYSAEDIDALLAVDLDIAGFSSTMDFLEYYTHVILPTLMPA